MNVGKSHFKSFICPPVIIPEIASFKNVSQTHLNNKTPQCADRDDFIRDNNASEKNCMPNANEPKGTNNGGNGLKIINQEDFNTKRIILGRVLDISNLENSLVIYVGEDDDDDIRNCLLLNFNKALHVFYDTSQDKLNEVTSSHKLLRKRLFIIHLLSFL